MRPRSLRFLPLALLPLLVAGCDEADTNLFTFPVRGINFTFAFTGDQVAGTTLTVAADGSANILDDIRDQGFGPEEVARVRLESGEAEVRILQAPTGVNIGFLDDVALRLSGGGTSVEVASAEDVSGGTSMLNEVDLDVSSEDIAPIVTAGTFDAFLDVSADEGIPDGTYRIEVRFDVEVAVEGF